MFVAALLCLTFSWIDFNSIVFLSLLSCLSVSKIPFLSTIRYLLVSSFASIMKRKQKKVNGDSGSSPPGLPESKSGIR